MAKLYTYAYKNILGDVRVKPVPFLTKQECLNDMATVKGWARIISVSDGANYSQEKRVQDAHDDDSQK